MKLGIKTTNPEKAPNLVELSEKKKRLCAFLNKHGNALDFCKHYVKWTIQLREILGMCYFHQIER